MIALVTVLARVGVLIGALLCASCASRLAPPAKNVSVGGAPHAWPTPVTLAADAAPRILAMHFSSLDLSRTQTWRAEFVTSTNTASLEVRTNLFAINVPQRGIGRFAFTLNVLDVPPIFLRKYELRVIARNAKGVPVEEDAPFQIR
jgi:hypothetical protein